MLPLVRVLGGLIGRRRRALPGADAPPTANVNLLVEAERISAAGSFECQLDTGELRCSSGLQRILGSPAERTLSGPGLLDRVHPEDRERLLGVIRNARQGGTPFSLELQLLRFDGTTRTVRVRGIPLDLGGDRPARLIGTIQDVTDEARARCAEDVLRHLVDSIGDAIFTHSADGTIISWNRAAERLYGYTPEEAIGASQILTGPSRSSAEHLDIVRRVWAGESLDRIETEHLRKDGTAIRLTLDATPVRDIAGAIIAAAITVRAITSEPGYETRLRRLADQDQLTGLFNRRRFDEELRRELARAARSDTGGALIIFDVDRFKAFNDAGGHAAGDTVLAHVARMLGARLRATDILGRLGGDQFAALLPDTGGPEARKAAQDLCRALEESRPEHGSKALRITCSAGVAPFRGAEVTADELLIHADLAMYAAKSGGPDRVVVYSAEQGRAARSLAREPWSERIRDALEADSFVLHLQPIVDLSSGKVSHGELLLRMRQPDGQLIPPNAFLPTAERMGLIHQIDRWVVKRAIGLIASLPPHQLPPVSVNLSGDTVVGDREMLGLIERELEQTGADPSRLIFEVTETVAIANMPDALEFTRGLIGLGCSLALDDFGTGFASFKYLKHLPVRFVKLDAEFIQNLPRSPIDEHVVRTIVSLARSLGIKTVAEAVTDDETIELLRTHEVDFGQGFHLGIPQPLPQAA